MWSNSSNSGMKLFVLIHRLKSQGVFKTRAGYSSRINPDKIDTVDLTNDLQSEPSQITKRGSNEKYFKAIVQNSGVLTNTLEEIDLVINKKENGLIKDTQYVLKAKDFAKEILMYPSKPNFSNVNHKKSRFSSKFNSKKEVPPSQKQDFSKVLQNLCESGVSPSPVRAFQDKIKERESMKTKDQPRQDVPKNNLTKSRDVQLFETQLLGGSKNVELNFESDKKKSNRTKEINYLQKEKRESFKKYFLHKKSDDDDVINKDQGLEEDIKKLRPYTRPVVYNLAYLVKDSPVLQAFVEMGVMIKKWEIDRELCEAVIRMDIERDIKPHLVFLHDINIPVERHPLIIEKNPYFFLENIDDLQIRYNYLVSKKFKDDEIVEIITKAPRWLRLSVEQVDTRLGWIQQEFKLTGNEMRELVISKPKLVTLPLKIISDVRFCLKDFLGFDTNKINDFIVKYPKLFTKDIQILQSNYTYLTRVVKLSNEQIATYIPVLQTPLNLLKTRYAFLKHLGRLQFDVAKPNFISIKNMVDHDEKKFLSKYAKSTEEEYKNFMKNI